MIVELGHFALILALLVAVVQTTVPVWGVRVGDARLMAIGQSAALVQLALLTVSFLGLTYAYVTSDFSVANVATNSHSTKPLIYKISGVWGNHEGSMLLWVLILAAFGAAVAAFGGNLPLRLKALVLAVQGSISVAFCLFIVTTSNPFLRINPAPFDGSGLNPILQDPALAFHPPFLYAGYVGFSMAFSFAIAALIEGRTDAAWARWVRPWTLAAWMCLTLGIAMGSWWAYYELGWGGMRTNGLEASTMKARKVTAMPACTESTLARRVAGRLLPKRATAAPNTARISTHRSIEPSWFPHTPEIL